MLALQILVTILCVTILGSSFCRATLMDGTQRRDAGYSSAAMGAVAVVICWSAWVQRGGWATDFNMLGLLAAVAWNQLVTVGVWRHGTPPELRRG